MIKINGKEVPNAKGMTVRDYLLSQDYRPELVAVELNCNILPKPQYETHIINEGDILEIVCFMGGG